ncbi:MAG: protein-L-isoaspartate(D-aspartate) O-methyltransferase [Pseudomonadales bacterium]|nr:protein-L-isoaspartate(D-aspartate) O-methyltransferase [Pseudomonadales bacterium]
MTSPRTRGRLVARLRERGISNEILLDVINGTPRHLFVDEALSHRAYEDTSLPIGYNQTISQPYTVARMTELLLEEGTPRRVLEIGTGCGYQTAILSGLVEKVYTVERISALLDRAREHLKTLGVRNVQFKHDDGNLGWPERGPFDGIIVTASPRHIPAELLAQLEPGGRMIIPVGTDEAQHLTLVRATDEGYETEVMEKVKFVPLLAGRS